MGSKKATAKGDIIYSGTRSFTDNETGEIIEVNEIIKRVTRQGFVISYLSTICDMIESIGNKKMDVVKYILKNMDMHNNTLIITQQELVKKTHTSVNTVVDTLKALQKAKIITRRTGALMMSEKLIHKGNAQKEAYLLTRFKSFNSEEQEQSSMIDVTPLKPPQLPPPPAEELPQNNVIEGQISLLDKLCPHCNAKLKLKKDKTVFYCPNLYEKNPQKKCKGYTEKNEN